MEKTTITDFIKNAERVSDNVLSSWGNGTVVTRVGDRSFMLTNSHSWGTAYCDWSYDKSDLVSALRTIGAINIKGTVGWNHVRLYFDLRKNLIIEE